MIALLLPWQLEHFDSAKFASIFFVSPDWDFLKHFPGQFNYFKLFNFAKVKNVAVPCWEYYWGLFLLIFTTFLQAAPGITLPSAQDYYENDEPTLVSSTATITATDSFSEGY